MEWAGIVAAVVFAALGLACVLAVAFGLPGTWLMLGLAALLELADGAWLRAAEPISFGWGPLGVGVALAGAGEIVEAVAGAAGARFGGATRRGMVGAILGGIVGALVFTLLVPIPLVGTLLGALVGTFVGALVGELTAERRRSPNENLRAALAAAAGRLAGTLGKLAFGVVAWVVLVRAAFAGG